MPVTNSSIHQPHLSYDQLPASSSTSSPTYNHSHGSEEFSDVEEEEDDDDDDDSIYTYSSDLFKSSAQKEWEDSIVQLTTLLNFVLIPLVGRMIGRRFSGYIWRKFANVIWKLPLTAAQQQPSI